MTKAEQRAAVVAEARSWIRTPWHHAADIKGHGVDCGMLLVRVFVDTGIVPPFDPRPYPPDWFLHTDADLYLGCINQRAAALPNDAIPQPGDLVLWRIGKSMGHAGIITEWPNAVHAYAQAKMVLESDITQPGVFTSPRYARRFFTCWPCS